jgi:hypothetical protein
VIGLMIPLLCPFIYSTDLNGLRLLGTFDTAGEVGFRRNECADKPDFQARAESKSCAFQTSPAVSSMVRGRGVGDLAIPWTMMSHARHLERT